MAADAAGMRQHRKLKRLKDGERKRRSASTKKVWQQCGHNLLEQKRLALQSRALDVLSKNVGAHENHNQGLHKSVTAMTGAGLL